MKKIDSLNLIPFIDIVLVLLVIVLTTATFIKQNQINIEIPKVDKSASNISNVSKSDRVISIDNDGNFYLDDKKISFEELKYAISKLDNNTSIVINGHKDSNFENFIKVMNMLSDLEYKNLFVLVDENTKSMK